MKNNYILIDFENILPFKLQLLNRHSLKLIVLVGANQKSITFDFASALHKLGEKSDHHKIIGNGISSLDFHIVFYIGELAATDTNAYFHIIVRDKGFDPLISYLLQRKIYALCHKDRSGIPFIRVSKAKSIQEKINAIVEILISRRSSLPRKTKALASLSENNFGCDDCLC